MASIAPEIERLRALRAIRVTLLELKWLRAATRFEIAVRRHALALKAGFNADQPRVPKGSPEGGQWTGEGSGGGDPQRNPKNDPPESPDNRPSNSRTRTTILKEVARRILRTGEDVAAMARMGIWLRTYSAEIQTYNDPPKSLEDLQRAASTPAPGYDIHHIVEQTQAERDGFTREAIDSPDNLVQVPRLKHQEINGWYQTKNAEFGWQTPRDYLNGRNWEVRRAVGLEALRIHGVLAP
ncbi:MAG TPA: hypothetical protein VFC54_05050 [Pseudolabrys sp.]|nr:hypothetical protein [Pseudolabrys sp.]